MRNRIIMFSGGKTSFAVADLIEKRYPKDNIVLYFTDVLWEDEDLYRFIYEVSDKLKLPMLIQGKGVDPVALMIRQKIVFNNRFGQCSLQLKMKVAMNFIKKGKKPKEERWYNKQYLKDEDILDNPIIYFGIDFTEAHRVSKIKNNWLPIEVDMPLVTEYVDVDELYKEHDIRRPRAYDLGLSHNNCKGRCVKAGKGHYIQLYKNDRETFEEICHIETTLSLYVGSRYYFKGKENFKEVLEHNTKEMWKWYESKYAYQPNLITSGQQRDYTFMKELSLKELKKRLDSTPHQLDLFEDEIGGCGCFIE